VEAHIIKYQVRAERNGYVFELKVGLAIISGAGDAGMELVSNNSAYRIQLFSPIRNRHQFLFPSDDDVGRGSLSIH
jgi:hypothetical protein